MTIETRKFTIEATRTHLYFRAFGWEGLLDLTGQLGSSLNRV